MGPGKERRECLRLISEMQKKRARRELIKEIATRHKRERDSLQFELRLEG